MDTARDYEPQPLIEAVTSLDRHTDNVSRAIRAVQETILLNSGKALGD